MKKVYAYLITGSGADEQTWTTDGTVECEFDKLWDTAMRDSFHKLTSGKAVFGKPGVGCKGPYDIHNVAISQVRQ